MYLKALDDTMYVLSMYYYVLLYVQYVLWYKNTNHNALDII